MLSQLLLLLFFFFFFLFVFSYFLQTFPRSSGCIFFVLFFVFFFLPFLFVVLFALTLCALFVSLLLSFCGCSPCMVFSVFFPVHRQIGWALLVDYFDVQLLSLSKDGARKLKPFTNDRFMSFRHVWAYAHAPTTYCESQPKAWAEYRYKAKLIQGVWGEEVRPIWAILGRWSPELGAGTLKKGLGTPSVF